MLLPFELVADILRLLNWIELKKRKERKLIIILISHLCNNKESQEFVHQAKNPFQMISTY